MQTGGQKLFFLFLIIMTLPWSLIYLFLWSNHCAYCGRRILFNKKVCGRCTKNAHAIVDQFESKINQFYDQMKAIDDIEEIITQYDYVLNQLDGVQTIYQTLEEDIDIDLLKEKTLAMFKLTLDAWLKKQPSQEALDKFDELIKDKPAFKTVV